MSTLNGESGIRRMSDKRQRQERIRELLGRNQVRSQEQLLALLRAESIDTTQATLSRDLRELGVSKQADGYALPGPNSTPRTEIRALDRSLHESLVSVRRAGNLVVLRTHPGLGQPLGLRIEQAQLPQVLGTIAATDTIFVATASWTQAEQLVRHFRRAARL